LSDFSNVVDIYDTASDTWSLVDYLSQPVASHSMVGVGNCFIVAGGMTEGQERVKTIQIFYDQETSIISRPIEDVYFTVYPNPCSNTVNISTPNGVTIDDAIMYNQTGQKVMQRKPVNNALDISKLQQGVYIIELVVANQTRFMKKLIIEK
ncbi:MAG TPA: T9SS type A sorting domain-containing protein, partial [Saprospiraceae bacterium]|nr:T9SS type A sorting domain-containing protein [Saprospiraceae bacterium]